MKNGRVLTEKFSEIPPVGSFALFRNKLIRVSETTEIDTIKNVVVKSENMSYPILECQWEEYSQKIGEHVQFIIVIFDNKEHAAIYD